MAFSYNATVERVVDGDTLDVVLDLGFHTYRREKLRLLGVNTPEMNTVAGKAARLWVLGWMSNHAPKGKVQLATHKADDQDKYGRYLAVVLAPDGASLNDDLVANGQAVPYMTP